jgi:hypothetical protein
MKFPKSQQLYFLQLLPLSECKADDGRVAGHLLMDLIEKKRDNQALAIRAFVNCMAMLRECGFRMGEFLVALISARASSFSETCTAVLQDPASVTNEQAAAIGRKLASTLCQPPATAVAVRKAVDLHSVLRTMRSRYAWFVPMLEVLLVVQATERRRSTSSRRLSSLVVPDPEQTATAESRIHVEPNAEGADDGSFDSVVWVGRFGSSGCTLRDALCRCRAAIVI